MAELRAYGVQDFVAFPIIEKDAADFKGDATPAAGDVQISRDGAPFTPSTNTWGYLSGGSIGFVTLTAAEMSSKKIVVQIVDQDATKEFEDQAVLIETTGNANAQHPNIDVDLATSISQILADLAVVDGNVDAVKAETDKLDSSRAEPVGVPGATDSPLTQVARLYAALVNRITVSGAEMKMADSAGTDQWKKALSDDGTTYTEAAATAP